MNSLLKIKEKIAGLNNGSKALAFLLPILAITLICAGDGSRIKIMSAVLWMATFLYMGSKGRIAVPLLFQRLQREGRV